jgi:hypothetical protein
MRNLFGEFAADGQRDIDLPALQGGQPGRFVGDHFEGQAFDRGRFAPVLVEGLQHEFDAW